MTDKWVISNVFLEPEEYSLDEVFALYGGPSTMKSKITGYLAITNHRLIFFWQKGRLKHSYHCRVQIKYEDIQNVKWSGKSVEILDLNSHRHNFRIEKMSETVHKISQLIKKRKVEIRESIKSRSLTLDFSELRRMLEKGGIILDAVTCPECSAPLVVPNSGDYTTCSRCGNLIDAKLLLRRLGLREGNR